MEYKGIRYALRRGIALDEWSVAAYPPDTSPIEKYVKGPRQSAEKAVWFMIDTWLKLHGPQGPRNSN